jgi:hypothetical protein
MTAYSYIYGPGGLPIEQINNRAPRAKSKGNAATAPTAKTPMAAEAMSPDRVYQSRPQVLFGWSGVAVMVGVGVMVLLLPTARLHGGSVIVAFA